MSKRHSIRTVVLMMASAFAGVFALCVSFSFFLILIFDAGWTDGWMYIRDPQ